ncbi:hypothetical protein [Anaeromicrobium sediminis]|uniref:Uncharacterized protein n=1 Tax=Anaeromicrobium sediminis TaxID=1478221 RepID=A0A267MMN6_9FIRM|nr:hypothetical protein [Anaeromicrobium sediminis]PAB60697.1 hypothetical protein CCE28_03930 [Anaeromicrobium sediminis]
MTNTFNIILGKDKYILLMSEDRNNNKTNIQLKKNHDDRPVTLYYTSLNYVGVKIYNKVWNVTNDHVVVFYSEPEGNGEFISYDVLGIKEKVPRILIGEKALFQGTVFFYDTRLIRGVGNKFKVWSMDHNKFAFKPFIIPPYPNAHIIRYGIDSKGNVYVHPYNESIKIGSIVQLLKKDLNNYTDRTLISSIPPNCVKYMRAGLFKVNSKGSAKITIIPQGYDLDRSKDINLNIY